MSGNRIMIVEDEVIIGRELQGFLEDMGYLVCGLATTPQEAIQLAEKHSPDLALMDINLNSEVDGIETAKILRDRLGMPAIFLTAHADSDTLGRAKEVQPFGYMVKPVAPIELRATMEMVDARIRLEKEREQLIANLQLALAEIRQLSGLLPICSGCKKIRTDKGYWEEVEEYISQNTDATFTHGICPDCVKKFYPDLAERLPPK